MKKHGRYSVYKNNDTEIDVFDVLYDTKDLEQLKKMCCDKQFIIKHYNRVCLSNYVEAKKKFDIRIINTESSSTGYYSYDLLHPAAGDLVKIINSLMSEDFYAIYDVLQNDKSLKSKINELKETIKEKSKNVSTSQNQIRDTICVDEIDISDINQQLKFIDINKGLLEDIKKDITELNILKQVSQLYKLIISKITVTCIGTRSVAELTSESEKAKETIENNNKLLQKSIRPEKPSNHD